jgi:hypothetical protein
MMAVKTTRDYETVAIKESKFAPTNHVPLVSETGGPDPRGYVAPGKGHNTMIAPASNARDIEQSRGDTIATKSSVAKRAGMPLVAHGGMQSHQTETVGLGGRGHALTPDVPGSNPLDPEPVIKPTMKPASVSPGMRSRTSNNEIGPMDCGVAHASGQKLDPNEHVDLGNAIVKEAVKSGSKSEF